MRQEVADGFKLCILEGAWEAALGYLPHLIKSNGEDIQVAFKNASLLINQQIYMELLDRGATFEAVSHLRNNIAEISNSHKAIQDLSRYIYPYC